MADPGTEPFSAEMEAQVCERVTSAERRHGVTFPGLGQTAEGADVITGRPDVDGP